MNSVLSSHFFRVYYVFAIEARDFFFNVPYRKRVSARLVPVDNWRSQYAASSCILKL
jgi:hypothetical protein